MRLTPAEVTAIRTSGLTDTHWAQRLRTTVKTVRHARIGATYRHIPTPPDLILRQGSGCCRAHIAGLPVKANRRQRWSYFRE